MLSHVLSALGKPAHPPTMATWSSVDGCGLVWFEHNSEAAESWLRGAQPTLWAELVFLEVIADGADTGEPE